MWVHKYIAFYMNKYGRYSGRVKCLYAFIFLKQVGICLYTYIYIYNVQTCINMQT